MEGTPKKTYTNIHKCRYIHKSINIQKNTHALKHKHIRIYIYILTQTHIYINTSKHTNTVAYIYTQTHIYAPVPTTKYTDMHPDTCKEIKPLRL